MDSTEIGFRPTPETAAKAVEGEIGRLQRLKYRGRPFLSVAHVEAAWEIETAYRIITAPLEMVGTDPSYSPGRLLVRPPEDDLRGHRLRAYKAYGNWVDKLDQLRARILHPLTIDTVVDGRRLRQSENRYQLGVGEAKHRLKRALGVYLTANGRVM